MIFSRNRGNQGRHSGSRPRGRHVRGREADDLNVDDGEFTESDVDEAPPRPFGPWDLGEAPQDGQERLDLGALRIPAIAGVEIQLQAGPEGEIQQIVLAHASSRLQLGVFAAPRTEGIWDEIRESLRESLTQAGATPRDATGDYGPELRAQVRDGSGTLDVRHLGVDGPRWFVHGIFLGAAAIHPDQAGPLGEVLRGLVVDRGVDARPVSEALPLRLPPEAAAQLAAARAPAENSPAIPATKAQPAAGAPARKAPPAAGAPARKAPPAAGAPARKAPPAAGAPARKAPPAAGAPVKKTGPAAGAPADTDPTEAAPAGKSTARPPAKRSGGRGGGRRS